MTNPNLDKYTQQAQELLRLQIITQEEYEERIQDYTDYINREGSQILEDN